MRRIVFLMAAALALAEPPADVLTFFSSAAEALADGDSRGFMGKFDRNMPGFSTLRGEIEGLLAAHEIGSAIEVVNDDGDNQKRTIELDWLLSITSVGSRWQIVKCRIERRGREWKIVAIEPIELQRNTAIGQQRSAPERRQWRFGYGTRRTFLRNHFRQPVRRC